LDPVQELKMAIHSHPEGVHLPMSPTRRGFLSFAARAGALTSAGAQGLRLRAQQGLPPAPPGIRDLDPRIGSQGVEELFKYYDRRSKVALIQGDSRRKNI
jgi:hypothetical protein